MCRASKILNRRNKNQLIRKRILILQSVIMGLVAIFVVWISIRIRRDIDGTYRLARWTAIIGGTL
jgi:hypothetical protein